MKGRGTHMQIETDSLVISGIFFVLYKACGILYFRESSSSSLSFNK